MKHEPIPALCPVKEMSPYARAVMSAIIRYLTYSLVSASSRNNLGLEGTEQALQKLYDMGILKVTFEPNASDIGGGRVMQFNPDTGEYGMITHLDLEVDSGAV